MKYFSCRFSEYVVDNFTIIANKHIYTAAKCYPAKTTKLLSRIYFEIAKRKELKTINKIFFNNNILIPTARYKEFLDVKLAAY